MIISVEELRQHITTDKTDQVLEDMLQALELSIRKNTNNNFQHRGFRFMCDVSSTTGLQYASVYFNVGDTVQVSESALNNGIYTIASVDLENGHMGLNEALFDDVNVLVTKVVYPFDVKMGAINIIKWQLKNEAANNGDKSKKEIQSETISRHSVTYVTDASESDIDDRYGVPKKYTACFKKYNKARF